MKKVKIIPNFHQRDCITIHPVQQKQLGIEHYRRCFLRFGINAKEVSVISSFDIESNELLISENVISHLLLPLSPGYELIIKNNELHIGPYIGIVAAKHQENLEDSVSTLSNYLYDYEQIGGAILAFSLDQVSMDNQRIEGYMYNPQSKSWEQGIYAYPSTLFKRTGMTKQVRNHFQTCLGNRIFNNYTFNKWEMYQMLNDFEALKNYLPETILYKKSSDIMWFLDEYGSAYVKPISSSQGVGIIHVAKKGSNIVATTIKDGTIEKAIFHSTRESKLFFRHVLTKDKYLIQEAIKLKTVEDSLIDFRLLIVKNQFGEWEDVGVVGRYGTAGSIVSNISTGGSAETGETILKKEFGLSDEEVYQLRKHMTSIGIDAAKAIEACGIHCGNFGIDMAIDEDLKPWIIEINNKDPNHTIAIDAGDRQMFYRVKKMNMLYAKKLAGFTEEV